ncbi:hypothetical protein [Cognatilysobacter segetis]|uniref:hypothetical protein n=1 Tax=Cognatilysobacter segetis TaxID=2492394 RepID=UPI00105BDAD4|nr:hypothetical protein [Lysobacter segetis]
MNRDPLSSSSDTGRASARREPLSGPGEARSIDNALHDVDLQSGGEFVGDHQRDRDSKGVAGGYDDSIARRKHDEDRDRRGTSRGD